MRSVKDSVVQNYIQEHCPNSTVVSWNEPNCDLTFYTAEQLHNIGEDWFPLCCYQDATSQKVVYGGRGNVVHTYTEGETGAGKTSRFAMQSIRALSCLKEKPSFVVVDIHGELIENLYPHLKASGYEIKVLNCDDPGRSDTYNPLESLVKRCQKNGKIDDEVIKGIRKIAEIIQPVVSTQEPIWEQGARSYTNGCILDKFEDLIRGDIPPQAVTLYNIIRNHYWIRDKVCGNPGDLMSVDHYKKKSADALSVQKMISVTNNAERTRASYFGVIENHYDVFGQPSLYRLSSNSTIDIESFIDQPTAIFIQSGSTQIGDHLISLLVNEIYTTAVIRGKQRASKMLPRKIHCFLDEFANSNIAEGPEFIKMLTTSRKFGMYWHLLVQCDAQLDSKFDAETARIIRANCTEIFMGSNEHETMVRFAKSCGQKTVEALSSMVNQETPMLETVDLITVDKLSLAEYGHVYVKSNRHPLLHSYLEAFYCCPEFVPVEDIRTVYPENAFDYTQTAFFPDDILPELSNTECEIVKYLYANGQKDLDALKEKFVTSVIDKILSQLTQLKLIAKKGKTYRSTVSAAQHALLLFRQARGYVTPDPPEEEPQESAEVYFETESIRGEVSVLSGLTCVPLEMVPILRKQMQEEELTEEEREQMNPKLLSFQITEAFLASNNFKEKDQWITAYKEELETIESLESIPMFVRSAFANALKSLDELTMQNIREIKKIIDS